MKKWSDRNKIVSHLFNPAFTSIILWKAVKEYQNKTGNGLDFTIAFFVLPLVLHARTRNGLPRAITTNMIIWLQDNPWALVGLSDRIKNMVPFTKEAILWASHQQICEIQDGKLYVGKYKPRGISTYSKVSDNIQTIIAKAEFFGRWISTSPDSKTIFALWGVKP